VFFLEKEAQFRSRAHSSPMAPLHKGLQNVEDSALSVLQRISPQRTTKTALTLKYI